MRKLTQAVRRGAVQARGVVGAASARSELAVLQHRFPSEHPRFGRRRPELSSCIVRVSVACRVFRGVAVPRCQEFASSNVGSSLLCGVERGAEVAVPRRQPHNAPVSLGESSACQQTVVVSHAPSHRLLVAPGVRSLSVSAGVSRKAVVLALFHQRSNPSIEGTRSGLRPPRAPHVER